MTSNFSCNLNVAATVNGTLTQKMPVCKSVVAISIPITKMKNNRDYRRGQTFFF